MSIFVKYFLVFIVSMVPLFELRYTMVTLVPALGVNYVIALIIGIIGNFFTWCLNKGERGGKKLEEKAGKGLYWALFLFVGIPIPGTGAWTGTLAASMLKLDFKKTVLAVMAGVVFAGLIMMAISFGLFEVIF